MAMTMKQVRLHGIDDLRFDETPVPVVGPTDVVVRVAACGICGSDLGYAAQGGLAPGRSGPLSLGHEFSGVIAAAGADVPDLASGMRVVVNPDFNLIGSGAPEGGFAPLVLVRNARRGAAIHVIPDTLPADIAALAEPLAVALRGVDRAEVGPGSKVVVLGAGAIGLSAVVGLRRRGVTDIVSVDLSPHRLAAASHLGASHTVNPREQDLREVLTAAHGGDRRYGSPVVQTDAFIDAAGAAPALQQAVALARVGARLVVVALYKQPVPIDLMLVMAKELVITGSIAYPADEFSEVVAMLGAGDVDVSPMISHRFPFDEFPAAFATARDTARALKVMVEFPGFRSEREAGQDSGAVQSMHGRAELTQ